MIEVSHLSKEFKVAERKEGLLGALRGLVHRKYRTVHAVSDLTFSVPAGAMVGLIGPNGAGKSTTIKMLTGILSPTSGEISVAGFVPHRNRVNYVRNIGVVFGQRTQLWWDIAVVESLRLLKKMYNVSDNDFNERLKTFQKVLALEPLLQKPVRTLSLGERMRCDLAAALIHNPKILFLDEPTIGLDIIAKEEVRKFLKEINKVYKTTIILTTHDLSDIEEICERVMIIDLGKLIFDGALVDLKNHLTIDSGLSLVLSKTPVPESLADINSEIKVVRSEGMSLELSFSPRKIRTPDVIRNVLERFDVQEIKIHEPEIEQVVKQIYERNKASSK